MKKLVLFYKLASAHNWQSQIVRLARARAVRSHKTPRSKLRGVLFSVATGAIFLVGTAFAGFHANFSALPECAPRQGYLCPATSPAGTQYNPEPVCREPTFTWDKKKKLWVHQPGKQCSDFADTTRCEIFKHEDLPWRNIFAQKWDPDNPKTAPYGLPIYETSLGEHRRYNIQLKTMEACTPGLIGPYFGIPRSNYEAPCVQVPEPDKREWAAYYEALYNQHKIAWDVCRAPEASGQSQGLPVSQESEKNPTDNFFVNLGRDLETKNCTRAIKTLNSLRTLIVRTSQKREAQSILSKRTSRSTAKLLSQSRRCGVVISKFDIQQVLNP